MLCPLFSRKRIRTNQPTRCNARVIRFVLIMPLGHSRATLWIAQGIEPYMVARLLGHSDLKMLTKIYDHTSEETLRSVLLQAGGDTDSK